MERLRELRPLKGRVRVLRFHGNDGLGRSPYRTFLSDSYVTSDPLELAEEGGGHVRHEHLTFSNCVANSGDGSLVLELSRTGRNRATVTQLIEDGHATSTPMESLAFRTDGGAVRRADGWASPFGS
jgi:hypothetical protein